MDSKPEPQVWSCYDSKNIFMSKICLCTLIILADVFFDLFWIPLSWHLIWRLSVDHDWLIFKKLQSLPSSIYLFKIYLLDCMHCLQTSNIKIQKKKKIKSVFRWETRKKISQALGVESNQCTTPVYFVASSGLLGWLTYPRN